MISNIILREFDEIVGIWCEKKNIVYTRYCDDLTFSGILEKKELILLIEQELEKLGFRLNKKKTKLLTRKHRQMITGIVVNDHLQAPRTYRKELRKQIYYCKKFGLKKQLEYHNLDMDIEAYINSLIGKILFVLQINPDDLEFNNYLKWMNQQSKY